MWSHFQTSFGCYWEQMFMQHLLVDLKQVVGRQQIILVELRSGLVHIIQATKFQWLNNGHGMCLKCLCDFFNRSDVVQNIKSKRKLNLDFLTLTLNAPRLNMFQSMFQILLQIITCVSKKITSWLLLEPNFMFLQINQQVWKKWIPILRIFHMHICFLWMIMSF
jgi:hypothetical protein